MNIAIVTNMNGIGLQRDYELLNEFLQSLGHSVMGIQFDAADHGTLPDPAVDHYDIAIYLEVAPRNLMELSKRRWAFVNPDWCKPDLIQTLDKSFEKIFAKTREGERLLAPLFPGRVHYVGFMSRDQYDPDIERFHRFLHVGGNSSLRGTETVLDAWRWRKNGKTLEPILELISSTVSKEDLPPNVRLYEHVDEEQLKVLQNECMFHIYPSGTEGWGHAIHEALSVGAQLITTGRPPMSEIKGAFFLGSLRSTKYNLADVWEVSALAIIEAVEACRDMTNGYVALHSQRQQFLDANENFKELFAAHLEPPTVLPVGTRWGDIPLGPVWVPHKQEGQKSIAFLGNFDAPESTENQVLWALTERLDMHVEKLQENTVGHRELVETSMYCDAFLWIRTPGWLHVRDEDMHNFLRQLREHRIPSISMHLDKFWGLPEREAQIGNEAFWLTDDVWTADGSRQFDFLGCGVNHHWMKPAISEVYCHPGTPRDEYRYDVVFVGARDYHPEYPFRPQLVDFLKREYDDRFLHVTGIRGHQLNDVYASARVAVGDCIFAGTPNYWSDRLPETCGRYGFLLHPKVEGLNVPCLTYEPQNLVSLHEAIEFVLATSEANRRKLIQLCAEMVWDRDTWECRMLDILGTAGVL